MKILLYEKRVVREYFPVDEKLLTSLKISLGIGYDFYIFLIIAILIDVQINWPLFYQFNCKFKIKEVSLSHAAIIQAQKP